MRTFKILLIVLVVIMLTNCKQSVTPRAYGFTEALSQSIVGTWVKPCYAGIIDQQTYDSNGMQTESLMQYAEMNCTGTPEFIETVVRKYVISGSQDIDYSVVSASLTLNSALSVEMDNLSKTYGYSNWVLGVPQDITGRVNSLTKLAFNVGNMTYQIASVTGTTLFFGLVNTYLPLNTPSMRPTSLDTVNVFVAQ